MSLKRKTRLQGGLLNDSLKKLHDSQGERSPTPTVESSWRWNQLEGTQPEVWNQNQGSRSSSALFLTLPSTCERNKATVERVHSAG